MWFIVLSLVGVVSGIMLYVYSSNYKQGKSCFDYEVIHDMSDPEWDLCPYPTLADLCFLKTPKNVTPSSLLRKVFYSAWTAFLSMIGLAFLAAIVFGTLEFAGNLLCGMYFYNFYDDSIYLGLGYYFLIYECGAVSPKSTKAKISKFQTQRHFFKIYVHGYKNIKFFSKKRVNSPIYSCFYLIFPFYFQFWHNSGRSLPYFKQKLKILLV